MKKLKDFKDEIHKCSKCGICQSACPIYKITGNDCSVSRGHFAMLDGVLKNKLKLTKTINYYLDLCLKCGACTKACPSGVDALDIIVAAKAEYFNNHFIEKILSFILKYFVFGLFVKIFSCFGRKTKSKSFSNKVLYFGGCGSKVFGDRAIVRILNKLNIEVINPKYHCCGIYMLTRGDLKGFNNYIKSFIDITKKYGIKDIVTNCASCKMILKSYVKWAENEEDKNYLNTLSITNVFNYIKENNLHLKLKTPASITYHKPCHLENFESVKWVLDNTENLNYVEMNDYDKCCGLNGLYHINNFSIISKILSNKRQNILSTECKTVLTSCLGCEMMLKLISGNMYRVNDLLKFLDNNI